ncbi:hypothetical protein OQA88_6228 [Cercophora sp. LCS_1]
MESSSNDTEEPRQQANPRARNQKVTNACEACRAAKVKCQASNQLGICKSVDSSARVAPLPPLAGPSKTFTIDIPMPPIDEVTETFEALRLQHEDAIAALITNSSEDDDMALAECPMDPNWLLANDNQGNLTPSAASVVSSHASSLPVGASALSTPPSSTAPLPKKQQRTVATALGLQPQFNLDSAQTLLVTFRDVMLQHFPCVTIDPDATVADLARDRPFVLLAALAATSSSRTLQGHSLYDEEFRKILGLKFVAGGERSMQLLEGLVIYVAWYPFHLRPKNKQALHYVRMAVDIVSDLELDSLSLVTPVSESRIAQIRVYLATYFLTSHYATSWNRKPTMDYTPYTTSCVDILATHSPVQMDSLLAWKIRFQRLTEETHELRKIRRGDIQTEYQMELILKGIASQIDEWEARMPPAVSSNYSVRIALLFSRIFVAAAPLLRLPSNGKEENANVAVFKPNLARVKAIVPILTELFEYFIAIPGVHLNAFSATDWATLILSVVLGYRLSFAVPGLEGWGRDERASVRFEEYLDRLCRMGDGEDGCGLDGEEIRRGLLGGNAGAGGGNTGGNTGGGKLDVLSASKVVLGVVREKYRKRVAKLEREEKEARGRQGMLASMWAAATGRNPHPGIDMSSEGPACPMLDQSFKEAYLPYWDETFSANLGVGGSIAGRGAVDVQGAVVNPMVGGDTVQQVPLGTTYNDLWATISMEWAQDGANFENL